MRTAVASLALLAMVAVGTSACGPVVVPSVSSPPMSPMSSPALPTASAPPTGAGPTAPPPTDVPVTTPVPAEDVATLLFRLTWCIDTCGVADGTSVFDNGLVVWTGLEGPIRQRQLTDEGLAWVRAWLEGTPLLGAAGSYEAVLRPGAEPDGGGVTVYAFEVVRAGVRARIMTFDPGSYDERYWIVPEEMRTLAGVAQAVREVERWVPAGLWAGPPEAYAPQRYLLVVELHPGAREGDPRVPIEVDDVAWPLPVSIDTYGATLASVGEPGQETRCAVISADLARAIVRAEEPTGRAHDLELRRHDLWYQWARGKGSLVVVLQMLLPDGNDCRPYLGGG